jgi:hypothetical protein
VAREEVDRDEGGGRFPVEIVTDDPDKAIRPSRTHPVTERQGPGSSGKAR